MNPKVFISHASEDKERFVRRFAEDLRSRGVAAWLDEWEIAPGDSLVDKVFEGGLKEAEVVIIVVSSASIQKRWVREELNTSVINRIEGRARLIPVVIDDCVIPEAIKSIVHVRMTKPEDYEEGVDRIADAIFGRLRKPSLAEIPQFSQASPIPSLGLEQSDQYVLKSSCELSIANDSDIISPEDVVSRARRYGLSETQVSDSIRILGERGILNLSGAMGTHLSPFRIAEFGFEQYCQSNLDYYSALVWEVATEILNNHQNHSLKIAERLNRPRILINHIMNEFVSAGFCKKSGEIGTHIIVYDISPSMQRAFSG